ncbi:MAG: response regulator [Prochlorotrichaceae cyanobacterium]|jgi:CheY-like chemotaxis protein
MKRKILVIEDENAVRVNLVALLKAEGFEVESAADGQSGLDRFQSGSFDLVICDIMMPKLDGIGVLKALKSSATETITPFIFLTAKSTRADQREGMNLGCWDYITKPFTRDELLSTIQAQFEKLKTIDKVLEQTAGDVKSLRDSIQKLEALNQAQDHLSNSLIQELRNPLSNINMSIELLRKAETQEERDRYLKIFQEEYNRELALINQYSELKKLMSPETIQLMNQFKLLG